MLFINPKLRLVWGGVKAQNEQNTVDMSLLCLKKLP